MPKIAKLIQTMTMPILKEVLSFDKSYKYPFDSLQTLSILSPEDNSFRIFNWILRKKTMALMTISVLFTTTIKRRKNMRSLN